MLIGRRDLWIYLTGLLAAGQIGKMSPLMRVLPEGVALLLVGGIGEALAGNGAWLTAACAIALWVAVSLK